jgi:hypothetical protein
MLNMPKFSELKKLLKEKAASIHFAKKELKEHQQKNGGYDGGYFKLINELAHEVRHHHISYCLLKGKKYEVIEKYSKNIPDWKYIEEIKNEYISDVCVGQE